MNMKYRKKPIIIEAFQMTKERRWDNSEWPEWLHAAWNREPGENALWPDPDTPSILACGTLEGVHIITPGDYIIQGIKGEIYPCKPDIFEATYEAAKCPHCAMGYLDQTILRCSHCGYERR